MQMGTNFYAVENKDVACHEGLHLGKRSGGWAFQFKWHDWRFDSSHEENHPYRNFDELEEFLDDKVVKAQYGRVEDTQDFLEMTESWCQEDGRVPSDERNSWCIDGHWFVKGDWT